MSSFITRMPVDLATFKKLLPIGSDFESITFDPKTNEVQMRWSHRDLVTPFTYHEEFTVEMLKAQELPKSVKVRQRTQIPVNAAPLPEPASTVPDPQHVVKPVDKKPRRGVKKASDVVSDV